jgi:ankyrin repeat protein
MEPPPLTGRSPKRRARRSSNQDVIPPSVTAACKTGDDAVVAQFLAVRSNLLQLDTHAEDTSTLLHVAAESGTTKVIELLLANGASHRSMWKRALPQVIARVPPHPRRADESRARLSLRGQRRLFSICFPLPTIRRSCLDEDGQTALHMATAAGHLDAVKGTLHITFMHMHYFYPLPTTYYSTPSKASPEESARSSQCWTSIG